MSRAKSPTSKVWFIQSGRGGEPNLAQYFLEQNLVAVRFHGVNYLDAPDKAAVRDLVVGAYGAERSTETSKRVNQIGPSCTRSLSATSF